MQTYLRRGCPILARTYRARVGTTTRRLSGSWPAAPVPRKVNPTTKNGCPRSGFSDLGIHHLHPSRSSPPPTESAAPSASSVQRTRGTALGRRATMTSMSSRIESLWRSCATSTAIPSPGDWPPSPRIGRGRVSGTELPARLGRSRSNPTGPGTAANTHKPHSSRYRRYEWGTRHPAKTG